MGVQNRPSLDPIWTLFGPYLDPILGSILDPLLWYPTFQKFPRNNRRSDPKWSKKEVKNDPFWGRFWTPLWTLSGHSLDTLWTPILDPFLRPLLFKSALEISVEVTQNGQKKGSKKGSKWGQKGSKMGHFWGHFWPPNSQKDPRNPPEMDQKVVKNDPKKWPHAGGQNDPFFDPFWKAHFRGYGKTAGAKCQKSTFVDPEKWPKMAIFDPLKMAIRLTFASWKCQKMTFFSKNAKNHDFGVQNRPTPFTIKHSRKTIAFCGLPLWNAFPSRGWKMGSKMGSIFDPFFDTLPSKWWGNLSLIVPKRGQKRGFKSDPKMTPKTRFFQNVKKCQKWPFLGVFHFFTFFDKNRKIFFFRLLWLKFDFSKNKILKSLEISGGGKMVFRPKV